MNKIGMAEIKLTEAEIEAAVRVLRSGALRQGKECSAFEEEFAARVGAKFAVTSANGSAALHLAYLAFLQPGDEVLVPSFTFMATASMVTMTGGKPVFCDVDPHTFLLDLEDAARKVSPRTRAISPVHLFGNACEIDVVQTFSEKHHLVIVWDAAQAHGAEYRGRDVGSFGDFVAYSFYPSKNMFVGEGGMTCTDNDEYATKLRYLRTHGQTGKYLHTMLGLNYRMTDVEAALGREQLKRLDAMLAIRRRNGVQLNEGLAGIRGIQPQRVTQESLHAWHQVPASWWTRRPLAVIGTPWPGASRKRASPAACIIPGDCTSSLFFKSCMVPSGCRTPNTWPSTSWPCRCIMV